MCITFAYYLMSKLILYFIGKLLQELDGIDQLKTFLMCSPYVKLNNAALTMVFNLTTNHSVINVLQEKGFIKLFLGRLLWPHDHADF